jgi:hypothetical protein
MSLLLLNTLFYLFPAEVTLTTDRPITLSGGPLIGNYTFGQLHFHWGPNDTSGSENTVNSRRLIF